MKYKPTSTSTKMNYKQCSNNQVRLAKLQPELHSRSSVIGNLFTPWFKLIARDFLFGWWDELCKRKDVEGKVVAKSLAGLVDGSKVVKME
jgi:hypothetical protein